MTSDVVLTDRDYAANARYQRPWYWYDWANSAFVTTVGTVLFGPYLTSVATSAACPNLADGAKCTTTVRVLDLGSGGRGVSIVALIVAAVLVVAAVAVIRQAGEAMRALPGLAAGILLALIAFIVVVPMDPGSVAPYTTTVATLMSAVLLIYVGAVADRTPNPARLLGLFAWIGSIAAAGLFFVSGTNWLLGSILMIIASIALGCSLVVYDAILIQIAAPDDRDRVSSRGWALGYLGGGLLLALNLVIVSKPDLVGVDKAMAVRLSMLSAALWWALFTLIPVLGLRTLRNRAAAHEPDPQDGALGGGFTQLVRTFSDLRRYPQTMLFLLAYLFFNDGIQTVINSSALYGSGELGFADDQLIILILMVQFVAFGGALLFGRLAGRFGAWRTILWSLVAWSGIIIAAFFLPAKQFGLFIALGLLIGIVLGGSQALSRSLFSQMVPRSREAEFFALYQAMERGTSWFGTFLFGLVHQLTHSYRPAIVALIIFFVVGGLILRRVDVRQGILDAGNQVPQVV